jgi:hypothetical protein
VDDHLLNIFQGELETQCQFILLGAKQVNAALKSYEQRIVWFGLQGILVSAANASKLLWGSRKEPVLEARRPLRESVHVADDSPLSSRKLRNDFEHFDERLERWFAESESHGYLGRNIGPPDAILIEDKAPADQFGHFDPSTGIVTFWERSRSLNEVVKEADRILQILKAR